MRSKLASSNSALRVEKVQKSNTENHQILPGLTNPMRMEL
jgi:hypothetical protein